MNLRLLLTATLALAAGFLPQAQAADAKPLKVLLVTGGGFHDYDTQHLVLAEGIAARANIEVVLSHNPDKSTKTQVMWDMYKNKDWAKGYDVVIHDECSADVTDPAYVGNIIAAHRDGTPAVNLHCAMHCYRWGNFKEPVTPGADNSHWYEMIGLQSTAHGPQEPIALTIVDKASPIVSGMTDWTTVKEELYNNVQILGAHALVKGKQTQVDKKSGEKKEAETIVAWTNEFGPKKTKVFSTTIGHNNETVADARYLDLVTRGVLWAAGKLGADGKPAAGYEAKKK
jgi:type 1 glutamine amidotransferase